MEEEGLELKNSMQEIEVSNFIGYLLDLNMSRVTISRHLVSIRNFYKYLRKKNKVTEAPISYFELPEIKRNLPEVLSVEQVEMLIDTPDIETNKGKRDKAILELLYAAGLKATELIELKIRDVGSFSRICLDKGEEEQGKTDSHRFLRHIKHPGVSH